MKLFFVKISIWLASLLMILGVAGFIANAFIIKNNPFTFYFIPGLSINATMLGSGYLLLYKCAPALLLSRTKWLGSLFVFAGVGGFLVDTLFFKQTPLSPEGLISFVINAILLGTGYLVLHKCSGAEQKRDDRRAQAIVSAILHFESPVPNLDAKAVTWEPFFIYLRPFDSTNKYKIKSKVVPFELEQFEYDGYDDIERLTARALKATLRIIALGNPGEHRGAGRALTTEQDWQRVALGLIKHATFIFVIPSYHLGTLWEVKQIVEGNYLNKTIFITPPSKEGDYSGALHDVPLGWRKTQDACQDIGLSLPDSTDYGLLFRFVGTRTVHETLPGPNPDLWRKAFQRLIDAKES
ncbi:hypothetical protein PQQ86_29355 [Paraburkholderia sediminicola]|uniref:hypothetical protein n=1 Tax=Paraburkholderia sediminicola TaxID=458836 RepID=UPI0038BA2A64